MVLQQGVTSDTRSIFKLILEMLTLCSRELQSRIGKRPGSAGYAPHRGHSVSVPLCRQIIALDE